MNDFMTDSQWIGKFTDLELSPDEETIILARAARNPILRNELRLDRDISELMADGNRLKLSMAIRKSISRGRRRKTVPLYARIAASVAILVSLACITGLLISYANRNYQVAVNSVKKFPKSAESGLFGFLVSIRKADVSTSPASRRELMLADRYSAYTPRPEYEFLVGSVTRDLSVFILSPEPRVKCTPDSLLRFSWRWVTGVVPVCLEVSDNLGRVVLRKMNITDVSYTLNTGPWRKGLYYYKVTSGDELVTLGSISKY